MLYDLLHYIGLKKTISYCCFKYAYPTLFEWIFLFVCLRVLLHINPSMLSGERSRPDTSHTCSPKLLPLNPEDQARQGLTVHKESITTQQMVFTGLNFEGQIIQAHTWALHPSLWCISVCLTWLKNKISLMPLIQSNSLKIFMDLDMSAQTLQNTESLSPHLFNCQRTKCFSLKWLHGAVFLWLAQVQKQTLRIWMHHARFSAHQDKNKKNKKDDCCFRCSFFFWSSQHWAECTIKDSSNTLKTWWYWWWWCS